MRYNKIKTSFAKKKINCDYKHYNLFHRNSRFVVKNKKKTQKIKTKKLHVKSIKMQVSAILSFQLNHENALKFNAYSRARERITSTKL